MSIRDCVEDILGVKLTHEPVRQTLGLKLVFERTIDLSDIIEVQRSENGRSCFHPGLVNLADQFGLVAFENAKLSGLQDASVTGNSPEYGLALQDTFHRDFEDTATILYKAADKTRAITTDYAMAADVRRAISQLDRGGISPEISAALDIMQQPDYSFSSAKNSKELEASLIVQYGMPEFGEKVIDIIPADRTLRKSWLSEKDELVLHSNKPDYIVHGRVTGFGPRNILSGLILHPGRI